MTLFTDSGYNSETEFEVLDDYQNLKKGDIVKIHHDHGDMVCEFITEDNRKGLMFLPGKLDSEDNLKVFNRKEKQKIEKEDMWLIGFGDSGQLHESTIKEIDEDLVRVVVDRRLHLSGWWLLSKIQLVKKLRGSE